MEIKIATTFIIKNSELSEAEARELLKELQGHFKEAPSKSTSRYKRALQDVVDLHTPGVCSDPMHCATLSSNIAREALGLEPHK